jgi:hypothetical protein
MLKFELLVLVPELNEFLAFRRGQLVAAAGTSLDTGLDTAIAGSRVASHAVIAGRVKLALPAAPAMLGGG